MAWLYVPVEEGWNSESPLCLENVTDASFTWREKRLPPRSWLRVWKRASWLKLLSGMSLEHSRADAIAESLISSQRGSLASRSAPLESAKEALIPATDGLPLAGWYSMLLQASSSWRTSPALISFGTTTRKSDHAFSLWGSKLRRASSQRRRSARLIFGNGSSGWPTAVANDDNKSYEAHMAMKARMKGGPRKTATSLQVVAQNWPTPDTAPEAPNTGSNKKSGPPGLGNAATMWQTPATDAFRSRGGDRVEEPGLDRQARMWSTPHAHNAQGQPGQGMSAAGGRHRDLNRETESWATPMANDGVKPSVGNRTTADLSHQAQQMQTDGAPTSQQADLRQLRPVLNPRFVAALMGWPDLTGSASTATGASPSQWRSRFERCLANLESRYER